MRFGMNWFRSNIKCGSRIALFALLVQFALSFGHVHAITSAATSPLQVRSTLSELLGRFIPQVMGAVADARPAQQPVSNHDSDEHGGDICAICAVMAMANTALFATPPLEPIPQAVEVARPTTEREIARVASASVAFQPRAPPIS
jgi:hypothetical protein